MGDDPDARIALSVRFQRGQRLRISRSVIDNAPPVLGLPPPPFPAAGQVIAPLIELGQPGLGGFGRLTPIVRLDIQPIQGHVQSLNPSPLVGTPPSCRPGTPKRSQDPRAAV